MARATFKADRHLKGARLSKAADNLYKNSFQDLEDRTVYHDPLGAKTAGPLGQNGINLKKEMWASYEESGAVEKFEELHVEKGYPLKDATEEIAKNYNTGTWEIPIFHVPEVNVVNPERTPAADMLPRITTESDTVDVTIETDQPDVEMGIGDQASGEENYSYDEGTYDSAQYDVVGYGLATRLSDKMVLASDQIRSTQTVAEQAHANGIRQKEERQILLGTDHDADGFEGMVDIGEKLGDTRDTADFDVEDEDHKAVLREAIDKVVEEGADPENVGVFVDFTFYRKLRDELDTRERYESPADGELGFGFRILSFDGTPVMRSHALTNLDDLGSGDEEPSLFAVSMDNNYLAMLQDMTVKPLAKVGPQEQFATDAYGTFVSEAPEHIQYVEFEDSTA